MRFFFKMICNAWRWLIYFPSFQILFAFLFCSREELSFFEHFLLFTVIFTKLNGMSRGEWRKRKMSINYKNMTFFTERGKTMNMFHRRRKCTWWNAMRCNNCWIFHLNRLIFLHSLTWHSNRVSNEYCSGEEELEGKDDSGDKKNCLFSLNPFIEILSIHRID